MLHDDHHGVALQEWYKVWFMEETWRGPVDRLEQVHFIRDEISWLFNDFEHSINVVGTHTSKSVKLPVYSIYITKGYWIPQGGHGSMRIQLRNNFYDWKVSVIDPWNGVTDIREDFADLFNYDQGTYLNPVYFEGFDEKHVFGPLATAEEAEVGGNNYSFSASISGNYELYTFMWLLNKHLKAGIEHGKPFGRGLDNVAS